ncbi:hypothetical protein K470DRAFT_69763 [Piedraia hortae CBS 480.64]|uniref:Uncharacterized protein n=1 Tax=Piedraia hortae CBS 480.64 TaxID=1314780 RepID=A0A6A7C0B9_9PEZI|nr:hypothetical protein K470DRAFT_69763 [Piedraia hortae CBS 480.64]
MAITTISCLVYTTKKFLTDVSNIHGNHHELVLKELPLGSARPFEAKSEDLGVEGSSLNDMQRFSYKFAREWVADGHEDEEGR